jgi:hypothetical protein
MSVRNGVRRAATALRGFYLDLQQQTDSPLRLLRPEIRLHK